MARRFERKYVHDAVAGREAVVPASVDHHNLTGVMQANETNRRGSGPITFSRQEENECENLIDQFVEWMGKNGKKRGIEPEVVEIWSQEIAAGHIPQVSAGGARRDCYKLKDFLVYALGKRAN